MTIKSPSPTTILQICQQKIFRISQWFPKFLGNLFPIPYGNTWELGNYQKYWEVKQNIKNIFQKKIWKIIFGN